MKNILKTNKICYCLGGKFKTYGGEFPPLKALKKTLPSSGRECGISDRIFQFCFDLLVH